MSCQLWRGYLMVLASSPAASTRRLYIGYVLCLVLSQPYDVALNLMPSQDADGKQRDSWGLSPIRVTDLTVTPDFTRLVAVGMYDAPATVPGPTAAAPENGSQTGAGRSSETRVIVYDLATKQPLS